ncbi:MAG: hypothetical protein COA79_16890 [Planctomycetota bacterium]|nr:MAG: hypothetical protein COA79_16890 [Planctomycetota bacterium]
MKNFYIILFISILSVSSLQAGGLRWYDNLAIAKRASKANKKPILLWVGIHSFRTRPMAVTKKEFLKEAKKIICVNLDPRMLSDDDKEKYGVTNSHFSKFFYYDLDMNLLHSEESPPKSLRSSVVAMLRSMEKKEEVAKLKKVEEKINLGAKALWEKANKYEIKEDYIKMLSTLRSLKIKYPDTSFGQLAQLKIDKMNSDPILKEVIAAQKKEREAATLLRGAKNMIRNNKKSLALKKLEKIKKDYSDTNISKEALELLSKLEED